MNNLADRCFAKPSVKLKDSATNRRMSFTVIRLKNGLYSCVDNGKCPGYAGGGAFPYMDSITGSNTLTIRDLQSLYTNSPGSHAKPYTLTLPANSSLTCPEGTVLKTKANRRSYIDASGHTVEYEEKYCASTAQAGNGAVVIIW